MSILVLTSDTLVASPSAGSIEYSSPIIAATTQGTQRGIVPNQQYYRLDSGLAGSNVNTAQNIFGVGCTLSSSTVYEFEILFGISKSAGTTSHTISVGFGGTGTLNNIIYNINWNYSGTFNSNISSATSIQSIIQTATATVLTTAITNAAECFYAVIKGTVSVNAGGTFIPQYTLSAAPGGAYTTQAGSYMRIAPIGASGANTNVGTWA